MDERRFALIIATDQYEDKGLRQLTSPARDAEALAQTLEDAAIGNFNVQTLLNKPSYEVRKEIEGFFIDKERNDLLLLYFSCHGIKDEDGHLCYCSIDTSGKRLLSTAIESDFVNKVMQRSRSRKQVLLLDCCYSGAFARGDLAKAADKVVGTKARFDGKGRVVITASDAVQYALEGGHVEGKAELSVFTSSLVHGLKTGEADRDGDGYVSLDELYDYVHDRVVDTTPAQRPEKWDFGVQGKILIARNPKPVVRLVTLPQELIDAMNDPNPMARVGAVHALHDLLRGENKGLSLSAYEALEKMQHDDSKRVSEASGKILDDYKKAQPEKEPVSQAQMTGTPVKEKQVEKPKPGVIKLRSEPIQRYSQEAAKIMLKDKGFFDVSRNKASSGFPHQYEVQEDGKVVCDQASGLMWQQSGSDSYVPHKEARAYIGTLNSQAFAGYRDWRLPTLEEAMSLMEPSKMSGDLYIDPKFDKTQSWIWTSDTDGASSAWVVDFDYGGCDGYDFDSYYGYVRAVR